MWVQIRWVGEVGARVKYVGAAGECGWVLKVCGWMKWEGVVCGCSG